MRGEDAGGPGPRGGADGRGESAPPGASGGSPRGVGVPGRAGLAAGLGLDLEVSQAVPPNTRRGRGEWPMAAAAAVASGGGAGPACPLQVGPPQRFSGLQPPGTPAGRCRGPLGSSGCEAQGVSGGAVTPPVLPGPSPPLLSTLRVSDRAAWLLTEICQMTLSSMLNRYQKAKFYLTLFAELLF